MVLINFVNHKVYSHCTADVERRKPTEPFRAGKGDHSIDNRGRRFGRSGALESSGVSCRTISAARYSNSNNGSHQRSGHPFINNRVFSTLR